MSSSVIDRTKYRLQSGPMIHAPGVVRWAINGYNHTKDRPTLIKAITECWKGVTEDAAHKLLHREISYTVEEDDVVVFEA